MKKHSLRHQKQIEKTVEIEITKAGTYAGRCILFVSLTRRTCSVHATIELEEKNFNVKLTIIDTPGFGDYVNNRDSWMPIVEFLDDQHEAFMAQEQQPTRVGMIDMRVHACLYFIRPNGHTYVHCIYVSSIWIQPLLITLRIVCKIDSSLWTLRL